MEWSLTGKEPANLTGLHSNRQQTRGRQTQQWFCTGGCLVDAMVTEH